MSKQTESKFKYCGKCKADTLHYRNSSKTSFVMGLIHVVLTIVSFGLWLIPLILHSVLTAKIGGWKCSNHVKG